MVALALNYLTCREVVYILATLRDKTLKATAESSDMLGAATYATCCVQQSPGLRGVDTRLQFHKTSSRWHTVIRPRLPRSFLPAFRADLRSY